MTIYIDVIFFENVILNYIIIFSTAIISKSKVDYLKILISSIIGGIFSIVNYFIKISTGANIFLKILLSILIIIIAFNEEKIAKIIKQLVFFYVISFAFGGIAFMLLFFIKPQNIIFLEDHLVGTYPIKIAFLAGILGLIISIVLSEIIRRKYKESNNILKLEIFFNGKAKKINSLIDTGNLLKEPISNKDVIIIEKESLRELIEADILDNLNCLIDGKWLNSENIYSYKFKLIPFSSIGKENGLLIGFKPDYVKVYAEEEIIRRDVFVGIYDGVLSKDNLYTSLIGLNIIDLERSMNENFRKSKKQNSKSI